MTAKHVLTLGLVACVLVAAASLPAQNCKGTSVGLIPLPDLGEGHYQGAQGGLYPGGLNMRPSAHDAAGLAEAAQVQPLDRTGKPDPTRGRIVLLSLGMSNTTMEFQEFVRSARTDPAINPQVVVVDGAQGGQSAQVIVNPNARFWTVIDQRLSQAGVTRQQVQAVWMKEANPRPTATFPGHAQTLRSQFTTIMNIVKSRYPNARLGYLSSRTYAGYATSKLNPEPYAYESGFAVKWTIEDQIRGKPALNYDPKKGAVKAPWIAWGPYLWADGLNPRSDGLTYLCADFRTDGTHPSPNGARKVARQLMDFFKTDATAKTWFLATPTPVCGPRALVHPYGTGFGGSNGTCRLVAGSLPTTPTAIPFRLQAWGAPKGRLAMFLFGLTPLKDGQVPLFGGSLLVQTVAGFPAVTDARGKAALAFFPLPPDPAWCGLDFYFQVIVVDPNSPQGHDLSRGLHVAAGH